MDDAVKIKNKTGKNKPPRRARLRKRRYLYLPELQRTRPGSEAIGYACRAFAAWFAVWGLLLFINDAFRFGADAGFLSMASLIPVALLAAAELNWLGALIALGGASLSAAFYVIATRNPIDYAYASVISLYNGVCQRLTGLGYRSPGELTFDTSVLPPSTDSSDLISAGMAFTGILLAVIFTLSVVRCVRMLPVTVAGGVICVFIFTYNLSGKSWGFTLMLTALCGLIVMRAYEGFLREAPEPTAKKRKKPDRGKGDEPLPATEPETQTLKAEEAAEPGDARPRVLFKGRAKGSALGGFAGLAAMAVAFAILLFPTLSINKKWEEIESINTKMEIARQIVSSVIIGDTPDFSDLGYLGQMDLLTSRSTTASDRVFTGAKVMELRSNYNLPVYVRSFVSRTYDNDQWYVPQSYDINYFYQTFGGDFTGEEVTRNFYNLINPKLTQLNNYSNYVSRIEYGYVTTPVDIKLLSSSGNLLFLPSRYDPTVGLLTYGGNADSAYGEEYSGYSDGIVSTSWLNFNKSYRALTYIQSYRHEDVFANLAALDACYQTCRQYIEMTMANPGTDYDDEVKAAMTSMGLDDYIDQNAYERWYAQDDAGRAQFYAQYLTADSYNDYVTANYLGVSDTEQNTLRALAMTALSAAYPDLNIYPGAYDGDFIIDNGVTYAIIDGVPVEASALEVPASLTVYDKVMAVIDYLKDNYTYTLTPKDPKSEKLSSVDAFLFDTKEGYCVQFATAASLMLRTLGVPTRYCEGYIASEFKLGKSTDGEGRYTAMVRDYNAHAWIEVYVNDIGWLTFETTPEYYSGMYEHYTLSGDYNPGSYETPEYTPPEDIDTDTADTAAKFDIAGLIAVIAGGLAAVTALGAAVYFIWHFAAASRDARYRREDFISRALRHELEGDERRTAAVAVVDYITSALAVAGLRPRVGELPPEYRDRCVRVLRGEEPAKPSEPHKIKLPKPLDRLAAKIAAHPRKKPSADEAPARKTKVKKPKRARSGSLGVADEFTGAKDEYKPEPIEEETPPELGYAEIFGSIEHEEFGDGMAQNELRGCAEFLVTLSDKVYGGLNPFTKFWYRHVKHAI